MQPHSSGVDCGKLCFELDKVGLTNQKRRRRVGGHVREKSNQKRNSGKLMDSFDTSQSKKSWIVPDLPGLLSGRHTSSYNELDNRTIYDRRRDVTEQVLETEVVSPLPPVQQCSRFAEKRHDSQQEAEKRIVLKHVRRTNERRHFIGDRALVPSVYTEFFHKPATVKSYIRAMFLDERAPKAKRIQANSNCIKSKYRPQPNCAYCDVIGNRYCSVCIEYKNRRFAWSYENSLMAVPPSSPVQQMSHIKHVKPNDVTSTKIVSKSFERKHFRQHLPPIASLSEETFSKK